MKVIRELKWSSKGLYKIFTKVFVYIPIILWICSFIFSWNIFIPILFSIIVWGWITLAYSKRSYSRNIVYNYCIKNNKHFPRLQENKIVEYPLAYILTYEKKGKIFKGEVNKKEVSKLKFYLVFFGLYQFVDDDCDVDTVPVGYGEDILEGKHFGIKQKDETYKSYLPKFIYNYIFKQQKEIENQQFGKAFHLGDTRQPYYNPLLSTLWMFRNLMYNYNYYFEEIDTDSKDWFYIHFPKRGWHFGYLPKEKLDGSVQDKAGRMVWFTEDYDDI
jgi:hypothetical protein